MVSSVPAMARFGNRMVLRNIDGLNHAYERWVLPETSKYLVRFSGIQRSETAAIGRYPQCSGGVQLGKSAVEGASVFEGVRSSQQRGPDVGLGFASGLLEQSIDIVVSVQRDCRTRVRTRGQQGLAAYRASRRQGT